MNDLSKETKERLEADLLSQLLKAENEVRRIKSDLRAIGSNKTSALIPMPLFDPIDIVKTIPNPAKGTFNETIIHILQDGVPRNAKQLLAELNKIKEKEISYGAFSAQISTFVKKKKSVKIYAAKNATIALKFWYGLAEWFDGDDLKPEYKSKIKLNPVE